MVIAVSDFLLAVTINRCWEFHSAVISKVTVRIIKLSSVVYFYKYKCIIHPLLGVLFQFSTQITSDMLLNCSWGVSSIHLSGELMQTQQWWLMEVLLDYSSVRVIIEIPTTNGDWVTILFSWQNLSDLTWRFEPANPEMWGEHFTTRSPSLIH